jgi:Tol biopolymer transport system component
MIVYVRGGDHGANWPAEGNLQPDPNGSPQQPKMQVWSVAVSGGAPHLIGEGDEPVVSPDNSRVAFINNKRIWIGTIDGSKPAEAAFFARGTSGSPRWAPDGHSLAFVSDRDDHSFIGIFQNPVTPIRYVSPTTSRDFEPAWSPDGKTIAFIRMPGRGGTPRSALQQQPQPWAIWLAPVDGSQPAREAWKSGDQLVDSMPRTTDDRILRWAANNRLTFLSYHDGWPHLYSMQTSPRNAPRLLTAWRIHGRARLADARRPQPDLQREHRGRPARYRSAPHLQSAGGRFDRSDRPDRRHRTRMDAGRNRKWPTRRLPRIRRATVAAADGDSD